MLHISPQNVLAFVRDIITALTFLQLLLFLFTAKEHYMHVMPNNSSRQLVATLYLLYCTYVVQVFIIKKKKSCIGPYKFSSFQCIFLQNMFFDRTKHKLVCETSILLTYLNTIFKNLTCEI